MEENKKQSKSKNFFTNVGKALLYFAIYFGLQQIISFIFAFSMSFMYGLELALKGEVIDDPVLIGQSLMDEFLNMQGYMIIISAILTLLTLFIIFKIIPAINIIWPSINYRKISKLCFYSLS